MKQDGSLAVSRKEKLDRWVEHFKEVLDVGEEEEPEVKEEAELAEGLVEIEKPDKDEIKGILRALKK